MEEVSTCIESRVPAFRLHLKDPPPLPPPLEGSATASAAATVSGVTELDKDLLCPICMQIIKDAFVTSCGHSFCHTCITTHLQSKSDCPSCSQFLTNNQLFPNVLLNKLLKKTSACQISKTASPVEQFRDALQQEFMHREFVPSFGRGTGQPLSLLAEKKRKMEQDEAERNMQILLDFLNHLQKQKVNELNEVQTDLHFIKEDINSVERHRIDLYRARDRYSLKLRMLGDDSSTRKPWDSSIERNSSGIASSSLNVRVGMSAGNLQNKKSDGKTQVSGHRVQRKDALSGADSQGFNQSGLSIARKKRIHAQSSVNHIKGPPSPYVNTILSYNLDSSDWFLMGCYDIMDIWLAINNQMLKLSSNLTWFDLENKLTLSGFIINDLQECYLQKRRQLVNQLHIKQERDKNFIQKEGYNAGLADFQSVLNTFTYRLRVISELRLGDLFHSANIVSSIEFDHDDESFATAGVSRRIKVFDYSMLRICTLTKKFAVYSPNEPADVHCPVVEMCTRSKLSCLSWNKYSKNHIASSDYEGTVIAWDVTTCQSLMEYEEHEKRAWSVDFSQTEPSMPVSGSDDCKVKVWCTKLEASVISIDMKANICCVKYNPGSSNDIATDLLIFITITIGKLLYIYKASFEEAILQFTCSVDKKGVSYVKFLSENELISASTDSTLRLWDVKKNLPLRSFRGHTNKKNFVGLTVNKKLVARNKILKEIAKPVTWHRFSSKDMDDADEDTGSHFISAVCWKSDSPTLLSANSQGTIKHAAVFHFRWRRSLQTPLAFPFEWRWLGFHLILDIVSTCAAIARPTFSMSPTTTPLSGVLEFNLDSRIDVDEIEDKLMTAIEKKKSGKNIGRNIGDKKPGFSDKTNRRKKASLSR
ncbi:hypothetical protein CXB51_016563 [Gossypium anomalum]|uniref:RING-type domain-containing protein n=1 Tax=Gossypium anomalum TaxID=47600 RepID=A0A8J5Z462_9ROSI|nr:hypothetical protein CXB51_016563 [Gossypium anomalum]